MVKFNRRAEVTPKTYIYGFIVLVLLVAGGSVYMASFAVDKPSFIDNPSFRAFNESFNRVNDIDDASKTFKGVVNGTDANQFGVFGVIDGLINSVWGTFKTIYATLDFTTDSFKALSSVFGVPSWIITILVSLVLIMIAFSIFGWIFQAKT